MASEPGVTVFAFSGIEQQYSSEQQQHSELRCKKCNRLHGRNYGKRLELLADNGTVATIIVSSFTGRCPGAFCYFGYEWYPSRRKKK